jgi:hypothetical protein
MKCLAALVLLLSAQDQKLPVPDAADQKKAEAEIRSVFKEDFAKKTRDVKRALALRLLNEAADAKNTPASRYVVLLLSRDLAVEALDVGTIIASIDQLGKLYDVAKPSLTGATFTSSSNALKVSALNSAQKYATTPEDSALLGDAYLKVAEDTLKDKLFDDALSAAQAAEKYTKAAKATSALERAGQLVKEIPELKKEDDLFATAITTKADDPAAKLVKGRYSLFVVGDDKAGIENLVGCSDEGLKGVAKLEAAKPVAAELMVDIAEAWLALARREESPLQKHRYQERARGWFEEAMKNAGGILRTKIEKRLAELQKSDSPGGSKKPSIDLLSRIDAKRDSVAGTWQKNGNVLVGTGVGPHAKCVLNYTPPEEYDLSVVVERKEGADDFFVGLIAGKTQFTFHFDGIKQWAGPLLVDGKIMTVNGLGISGKVFENGKPRTVQFMVRKEALVVRLDGKDFFSWKADWKRVSLDPVLAVPKKDTLFIGVFESTWSFSKVVLSPSKS